MSISVKRIQKELIDLTKNLNTEGFKLETVEDKVNKLRGEINGPIGSPYEGGTFKLEFEIPDSYPFSPPNVKFLTNIWHPNVSSVTGTICLDTLKENWSAAFSLRTVMLSIQALMSAPGLKNPQDAVVASMYINNYNLFQRTASYWAHKYAGAGQTQENMFDDTVRKVVEMGFSVEHALQVLSNKNWDVKAATAELMSRQLKDTI